MHDIKNPLRMPAAGSGTLIPGQEQGTAYRVTRNCAAGMVTIDQMRHSNSAGWYVQCSFSIPVDVLPAILTELRKADCFRVRQVGIV